MDAELLRANLVRTLVPLIVGALASVPLLSGTAKFAPLIGFAVSAAYYAVFRIAETKYPALGVFLGKKARKDTRFSSAADTHRTDGPSARNAPLVDEASDTVSLKVDGVDVLGIESLTWEAGADGTPMLTLRILDPQVQFVSQGAAAAPSTTKPAATKVAHTVPAPRTATPPAH
jgi:hypothetical protein